MRGLERVSSSGDDPARPEEAGGLLLGRVASGVHLADGGSGYVNRRHCRLALLLFLSWAVGRPCSWAAPGERGVSERVDALIREAGIAEDGPGVAVGVFGPEGALFQKGYGWADLERKTRIQPGTTFELASVSKQFTGIAILILVERGKVSFDDDVRKYLPELPTYDRDHPITLGDLSRHTSGLPDYMSFEDVKGVNRDFVTNGDYIPEFAKQREKFPLRFAPGAKSVYSNTGYMLLASVVERASGRSFGTFLKEEVFDPLGMKTAWVNESPRVRPNAPAVGYQREKKRWTPSWRAPTADHHESLLTTGDGAVWCSLDDMAAWDAGLRKGKPVKMDALRAALAPRKARNGRLIAYAVGWSVEYGDAGSVASMWHDGDWSGFETYIGRDLKTGVTVVVLSNRGGVDAETLGTSVGTLFESAPPK